MDVYIYSAALYCKDCGEAICREIEQQNPNGCPDCRCGAAFIDHKEDPNYPSKWVAVNDLDVNFPCHGYQSDENSFDSNDYPKGPIPNRWWRS